MECELNVIPNVCECNIVKYVGFDSLTPVTVKSSVIWDVILRFPVEFEPRFGEIYIAFFLLRASGWHLV